jgi:molecular chaperone GrpE
MAFLIGGGAVFAAAAATMMVSRRRVMKQQQLIAGLKSRLVETHERAEQKIARTLERSALDAAAARSKGTAKLAKSLLNVADNLDRAVETAKAESTDDGLLEGVRLTQSQLYTVFRGHGIEQISPVGESFDPDFHEAVGRVEPDAAAGQADIQHNTVVSVMQPGYVVEGMLLRPARVTVMHRPSSTGSGPDADDGTP